MAEKALIAVIQSERLSLLYEAEIDVLAYISFRVPRAKLHSTNPLERVNGKIERRDLLQRGGHHPPRASGD
jgi:hypothetical protein